MPHRPERLTDREGALVDRERRDTDERLLGLEQRDVAHLVDAVDRRLDRLALLRDDLEAVGPHDDVGGGDDVAPLDGEAGPVRVLLLV